jgi:serine/threonine protein kinase
VLWIFYFSFNYGFQKIYSAGKDGHVRLADFGLSKEGVKDNDTAMSFCGTPAYLAPEMIKHKGKGFRQELKGKFK